ncbi:hypothetical protein CCAX7_53520 [Capsulimonas corticalis]|uniref:Copper amine oxidase-like N-terminal domain-containing protein n=2 Tax=Capsulimonas corticalis TaxID=2219043 RepID=A0A402CNH2_9BACT|nr:hypothetical protein CCAX7_53520 [Capsulimonas corticalis]
MGAPAMAQNGGAVSVVVNGSPVAFSGQGPVQSGRRVLVPLRGVLEKLGAYVSYDSASQEVRAVRNEQQIVLPIGGYTAQVDGNPVKLDVPAKVLNGSTMVPLRFVAEALGASVDYSGATQTVTINAGGGDGGGGGRPQRPPRDPGDGRPANVDAPAYRAGLNQATKDRQAGLPLDYRAALVPFLERQKVEFQRGYRSGTADARRDPTSIPTPAPRPGPGDDAFHAGYKQGQRDFLTKMIADPGRTWPDYAASVEGDFRAGYRAGR